MVAVGGIYDNGQLKLDEAYKSDKPVKVIVTFLEEVETVLESEGNPKRPLKASDYGWLKSRKLLEHYKGCLSDAVIEERRKARW